jgi:flagellar hook-associated protein 1 FlgK
MSSLINTAINGLNSAMVALNTTSNNISNASVTGYNVERATITATTGTNTMSGYIGNGSTVTSVTRAYDSFVNGQLQIANAASSALTAQYNQASQIDDAFSSTTTSLSTTMQTLFTGLQTLTSDAGDSASRQTVIGDAQALVSQFNSTGQYLDGLAQGINEQVKTDVSQINDYTTQIAALNKQISLAKGVTGQDPNTLLDQRDQLVSSLNSIVGVTVTQQDGQYNVAFANGTPLVQGDSAVTLTAVPSDADSSKTVLGVENNDGTITQIPDSSITTGSLGGAFNFLTQNLEPAINTLGQYALAFASNMNSINQAGYDYNGSAGQALFSYDNPQVVSNSNNTGSESLSATITDSSKVQASDYNVSYNSSTGWKVTQVSSGSTVTPTQGTDSSGNTTLSFDGLQVTVTGTPNSNDSFILKPVSTVASSMAMATTDPTKIAAASSATSGVSDNTNAQVMVNLQDKKVINGSATLTGAFASFISKVGSEVSTLKTTNTTQSAVVTQLTSQQQSVSGVNLDEEYGNLQRYQQYYQANAQVVQTAATIFNSILAIRQ